MKAVLLLILSVSLVSAAQLHVPDDYPTIPLAVAAASSGDSVMVAPGVYSGFALNVDDKSVNLIGEQGLGLTFLEPNGALQFSGGAVLIQGFSIDADDGRIYIEGVAATLLDCEVQGNEWDVAVKMMQCPTVVIEGCTIHDNNNGYPYGGTRFGAGVYAKNCPDISIRNTFFWSNWTYFQDGSSYGGAIYLSNCSGSITNCCFWDNRAITFQGCGGAICIFSSDVDIINCSFSDNIALYGSAVYCGSSSAECEIRNSISAEQYDRAVCLDGGSLFIEYSNTQYPVYVFSGTLETGEGNISSDPCFITGPLCPYHLQLGSSPCIDAGNPAVEFDDSENTEMPGYALWPSLGGLRNDMGVFGGPGAAFWAEGGTGTHQESAIPVSSCFELSVVPNPATCEAQLSIGVPFQQVSRIEVYDISGRCRLVQVFDPTHMGDCTIQLAASDLPPGCYIVTAVVGSERVSTNLVLLR